MQRFIVTDNGLQAVVDNHSDGFVRYSEAMATIILLQQKVKDLEEQLQSEKRSRQYYKNRLSDAVDDLFDADEKLSVMTDNAERLAGHVKRRIDHGGSDDEIRDLKTHGNLVKDQQCQ